MYIYALRSLCKTYVGINLTNIYKGYTWKSTDYYWEIFKGLINGGTYKDQRMQDSFF